MRASIGRPPTSNNHGGNDTTSLLLIRPTKVLPSHYVNNQTSKNAYCVGIRLLGQINAISCPAFKEWLENNLKIAILKAAAAAAVVAAAAGAGAGAGAGAVGGAVVGDDAGVVAAGAFCVPVGGYLIIFFLYTCLSIALSNTDHFLPSFLLASSIVRWR